MDGAPAQGVEMGRNTTRKSTAQNKKRKVPFLDLLRTICDERGSKMKEGFPERLLLADLEKKQCSITLLRFEGKTSRGGSLRKTVLGVDDSRDEKRKTLRRDEVRAVS